jgi:diacylglycerol O-acyltransferase / wax synthase
MERMSGIDPMFVYSDTRHTPMEIAYACVFDPATAEGGYSFEHVVGVLESRMPTLTPFRRRLMPVPLGLDNPRWVDDPDFDLSNHLHRVAAPAPGGLEEFSQMVAAVMGRSLLPEQPPWEMHVVEGLAGGMVGLIAKVHHSVIDGVAGAQLLAQLLDLTAEGSAVTNPCPPWLPAGLPSQRALMADALPSVFRGPVRTLRAAREVGRTAVRIARCALDDTTGPVSIPLGAPAVFESPVGARREVRFAVLDLNEVRRLKDRFGSTINDVVLAVCSGALRVHLAAQGQDPDSPLVAVVPVSVRPDEGDDAVGNQLSAMFVTLANDRTTPLERLRTVTEASASCKGQERAVGYGPMATRVAEAIPPAVAKPVIQLGVRSGILRKVRAGNLMISNVPGPNFPLYFAGMELRAVYPLGPVMDGVAPINITVQSYLDSLFVGINASAKASSDLAGLARRMEEELLLLSKMVNGAGPPLSAAVRHRRTPQSGGHRRAQSTSPSSTSASASTSTSTSTPTPPAVSGDTD